MWKRVTFMVAALVLVATACSRPAVDASGVEELPPITYEELITLIQTGGKPAVVNVWASWCIPCRSEAPLLRVANDQLSDRVAFIGINVQDTQPNARAFIAEFGLTGLDHYFDPQRAIPNTLGRRGVPITFFFAANGELVSAHSGVIDERTLAASIDELLSR